MSFLLVNPIAIGDAELTSTNVADDTAWNAGTTFAKDAVVKGHTPATDKLAYLSAQAGNLNHNPITDDGTWWIATGATNRHLMFDGTITSQTTNPTSIDVTLEVGTWANCLSLLNVSAGSVQVTITDAVEGIVYDETFDMTSDSGITDPYAYCFTPIVRRTELTLTDLPSYIAPLQIVLTETGGTAKCGACAVGLSNTLGVTLMSPTVGIIDFTRKIRDVNGNANLLEGDFAKRGNFTVLVQNTFIDQCAKLMTDARAKFSLFIASSDYAVTTIYGFPRDWNLEIAYPNESLFSTELEGVN